jgi:CRISPR/Cas system CSM-associated protein Csm2 small subunit
MLVKLDENLRNSGERLIEYSEESHGKFQAIREHLSKLFSQIDQQNNSIDSVYDQKMQYLHSLEEKVVERFENEAKVLYIVIQVKKRNGEESNSLNRGAI